MRRLQDRWSMGCVVGRGVVVFFFFNQMAAYEISAGLVGSDVCINVSFYPGHGHFRD